MAQPALAPVEGDHLPAVVVVGCDDQVEHAAVDNLFAREVVEGHEGVVGIDYLQVVDAQDD